MAALIGMLVVAALIGGVVWNHRTASTAMTGVEFTAPEPPIVIVEAIRAACCGGAKAKVKSVLLGVTVAPSGSNSFHLASKIEDFGEIVVMPHERGSIIRAHSTELYIGSHPKSHFKSGLMGTGAALTHGLYKLLGIAPGAAKMKRFQTGLEGRIARQLGRSLRELERAAASPPSVEPAQALHVRPIASPEPMIYLDPTGRRAPRLAPSYFSDILTQASLPASSQNLRATIERVATMFLMQGRQFIDRSGTPAELADFTDAYGHPPKDIGRWPQEILDGIVAWNPDAAEHLQNLPDRVRTVLLRSAQEPGGFFNRPDGTPLPTLGRQPRG